jgi:methionyl-tRNA formyltransferase
VQNESEATYCARRRAEDGLVNWADTTRTTFNLIRAVTRPYPGAFTYYGRKLIRVWAASPGDEEWSALPGQILRVDPHKGALIKTGDGTLWISELEVDGTSERPDHVFKHIGDKLGPPDTFALIQRIEELEAKLDRRAGGEN